MKCEIINVGTELLLGDILNTNAQFLSNEISALGFDMYYQTVVGDNFDRLTQQIKISLDRSDVVILTGGLGPTNDDITKEAVADVINQKLILNEEIYLEIKKYFKGREMPVSNKKQAYIPENAHILNNNFGTAPGFVSEVNGKFVAVLPGPPKELIPMFKNELLPYFSKLTNEVITSRFVKIFGVGESLAADMLKDVIDSQDNPTIAPYAKDNESLFRVTAKSSSLEQNNKLIDDMIVKIKTVFGDSLYGFDDDSLEKVVVKELVDKKLTVSFAESCTCGLLVSKIGNVSGASVVLNESYITYANEAKENLLNVKKETLEKFGAVSEETAKEMAIGLYNKTNADVCVSVTGIAGPDGGTDEKPVGLVYIGIYYNNDVNVYKLNLRGNRYKIRDMASCHALNYIRLTIKEDKND